MSLIAQLAIDNNGILFGGFVRDLILREHGGEEFLPRDIDIFMCDTQMSEFLLDCKMNHLVMQKQGPARCLSTYIPQSMRDDCLFTRYNVTLDATFWRRASSRFPVSLDVSPMIAQCEAIPAVSVDIISSDAETRTPFLVAPDFECNALFLDRYGLQMYPDIKTEDNSILAKHHKISSILEDIVQRKARLIVSTTPHPSITVDQPTAYGKRARSLVHRGWTVVDGCMASCSDASYTGHCIVCHDALPTEHVRFVCCDARYHNECMCRLLRSSAFVYECPMCRKALSVGVLPLCEVMVSDA
jgi:hypothetical protein